MSWHCFTEHSQAGPVDARFAVACTKVTVLPIVFCLPLDHIGISRNAAAQNRSSRGAEKNPLWIIRISTDRWPLQFGLIRSRALWPPERLDVDARQILELRETFFALDPRFRDHQPDRVISPDAVDQIDKR